MRFLGRLRLRDWRIVLSIGRVTRVQGVNSTLTDDNHMLMWEFDGTDIEPIKEALRRVQARYLLPNITIVQSHPDGGYHAYCWIRASFIQTVQIVSSTWGVDPGYITMCCARRHWTLRLTDKGQGEPSYSVNLPSLVPPESNTLDLLGGVHYEAYKSKDIVGPGWDALE